MQYELRTTLGVPPARIHAISELRDRLHQAIRQVLNSQNYTDVAAFHVDISESGTELIARMLFIDGVRAQHADDTSAEILEAAIKVTGSDGAVLREESVRLQSVY